MSTINKHIILIVVSTIVFANIAFGADNQEPNFTDFYHALETGTDEQAVQAGQEIFEWIERKYRADAGFRALKSRMMAADALAGQMIAQLKKATGRQRCAVSRSLLALDFKSTNQTLPSPPPCMYQKRRNCRLPERLSIYGRDRTPVAKLPGRCVLACKKPPPEVQLVASTPYERGSHLFP